MLPEQSIQTDTATSTAFLREITHGWSALPEPVMLELRCLMPERTPDISRFGHDEAGIAALVQHANAMNAAGLNCYIVVNPVRASAPLRRDGKLSGAMDEDIPAAFYFWADGDDEQAAHSIRNFAGPKYTMAVMTGTVPSPRPHVYWRCADGPMHDLAQWTVIQRGIARVLSTDRTVVNPSRIMRLPGTINIPTKAKALKGRVPELTTFRSEYPDARPPVTLEQMQRVFGAETAPPASGGLQIDTGSTGDRRTAEQYADILRRARTDGEKHGGVRDLAAALAGSGAPRHLAEAIIRDACPIWDAGVEKLIDTAYQKFAPLAAYADPTALTAPTAPTAASFDAPARPSGLEWFDDVEVSLAANYIVKGVLDQGAMSVIYGPSNSGKTFFALDMAFNIAIGAQWRGRRVKPCAVLYLAAEGGRGVTNRIAALKAVTGLCDVPLALKRAGLDLLHAQADLQHICDLAGDVMHRRPGLPLLIVIDTLSRVMAGGDENSAADMTALIRNIDAIREATGAHVCLVHHTGKDTARGARGHSSLRAATDTEIEVQSEGGARAAQVSKQRDNPGGETFAFSLKAVILGRDQDGDEVASCVVEAQDTEAFEAAKAQKRGLGGNQKILADTFDQMIGEGIGKPNPGGVGFPEPGRFMTVGMDEFRAECMGKIAASNKRGAFLDAWKALTDGRGLFCTASDLVWRTDKRNMK